MSVHDPDLRELYSFSLVVPSDSAGRLPEVRHENVVGSRHVMWRETWMKVRGGWRLEMLTCAECGRRIMSPKFVHNQFGPPWLTGPRCEDVIVEEMMEL